MHPAQIELSTRIYLSLFSILIPSILIRGNNYYANIAINSYLYSMTPAEINFKWTQLQERIKKDFDSDKPDIKVLLFLIGVQELGKGPKKFSKRQKEELMHIATCRLLSELGFYELEGLDQDGWPHWKLVKTVPNYTLPEQELLMKSLIVSYFEEQ